MILAPLGVRHAVGNDASPSGRLRIRHITPTTSRLEHEWRGRYGTIWTAVPHVDADGKLIDASNHERPTGQ